MKYADPRDKQGSIKLNRYSRQAIPNVVLAILDSGALLESTIKQKLGGPSHVRFPGNGNPYPGVMTGRLRSSVNFQTSDKGLTVVVGPDNVKARAQESGTSTIPARPYVQPSLKDKEGRITKMLLKAVADPLKR